MVRNVLSIQLWAGLLIGGLCLTGFYTGADARTSHPPLSQQATKGDAIWEGVVDRRFIRWTKHDLLLYADRITSQPYYSWLKDARQKVQSDGKSLPGYEYDSQLKLLSVVGPYISLDETTYSNFEKAAHPGLVHRYWTLHAQKNRQPVSLHALFKDADILNALMADPLVKKHLTELSVNQPVPRFQTTNQLLEYLQENVQACEYHFSPDLMEHFAFYDYDRKNNRVAVRIGLSHGCEAARGNLTEIGLWLPVSQRLQSPLALADEGKEGFLMQDSKKVSRSLFSRFRWGRN